MILVTGATGNIGRPLLRYLRASGTDRPLRALTRDRARASFPDGVEAVEGDLADPASLDRALTGARSLFLLAGTGPEEAVLAAARRAGVEHVVLVSSITVRTHPHLPTAARVLATEDLLRASGMAWTMLRPTQFASNTLLWSDAIRAHRPVRLPYPDLGLPTIHPADIAAVAASALTGPDHHGRTYPLTGPGPVTAREQVAALGAALGREVPLTVVSRKEAHEELAAAVGDAVAHAMLDLTGGDITDELRAVHDTVERVTGTPARPFAQWATENAAAFR
ncbi:SDR family oxidoreductase [Streptomyces avicenniae]|uniref:SDR family oxidoreductase n=1 Tax=Streptomyces avicenniae TaxID=500153 RepID=UPI00069B5046|nr:NAD(P)H-binding protein [Streptomyces avicenniae]